MKINTCLVYSVLSCILLSSCTVIEKKEKKKKVVTIKKVTPVVSGPTAIPKNKIFEDVTDEMGLSGVQSVSQYAVDFNNDGATDLVFLRDYYSTPIFFQFNKKSKRYEEIKYSPFKELPKVSFLGFNDFDKDGVVDLMAVTPRRKTELYQRPIRFYKGSIKKGVVSYTMVREGAPKILDPTFSAVLFDYNLDGELDLFLGNWFDRSKGRYKLTPDKLYKGRGFKFSNHSPLLEYEYNTHGKYKIYSNARPTYGVSTCDLDQDGYPDVLTSATSGYSNKMWMNSFKKGVGRYFSDYGKISSFGHDDEGVLDPRGGGHTFYSTCTDYNNDGIMDVVMGELSHSYDPETKDRSALLTGKSQSFPPKFIRTESYMDDGTMNWNQSDKRGSFFDYNLDGLIDIVVDNSGFPPKSRLILFQQGEQHDYLDISKKGGVDILNPSGTIVLDYNQDGRPDLLVGQTSVRNNNIKRRVYLYRNVQPYAGNRSLRIHLKGKQGNLEGLGATIKLRSSGLTQTRYVEYLSGPFPSKNESGPIFGLPKGEKLETVTVTWPVLGKNKRPLVRTYNLSKLKFKKNIEVTLCESGRFRPGNKKCN